MQNDERLNEVIDNDRLCKLLSEYYKESWHWIRCYFPRGNDFSMPYKPRYHSIVFSNGKKNVLIDYTPEFSYEKANALMSNIDWNFVFQNSKDENGQKIFHGILYKVDRFDLTIPKEISTVLSAYLFPAENKPAKSNTTKPKNK